MKHRGLQVAHVVCPPRKTAKTKPAIATNAVVAYTTISERFAIPANVCSLQFFIVCVSKGLLW